MSDRKERNHKGFNAEMLQVCFLKFDAGEKTKTELAAFYNVSESGLGNYFSARSKYEKGMKINSKSISVKIFRTWAAKYGKNGDPELERGEKSEPKQMEMPLVDADTIPAHRDETLLMYAYPRLMAFIREHESRLSTENGEHYVTLKLDDAAQLFLDELERRRIAI